MSIVLVVFPGAPGPNPEAVAAEKELDAAIERHVRGIFHILSLINYFRIV